METTLKRTCLYDKHVELGALISPFGGFEMPIQYTDIISEHNAVRTACGLFDVSHMGEVQITGRDAERFVQHVFTNDVSGAPYGKILYGMLLNPNGGVVDDLLVYVKSNTDYWLIVNASNIDKDLDWLTKLADGFEVEVKNRSEETAELAVQGTKAESLIERCLGISCADLAFYTFKETEHEGQALLISRTGYTGEDGFEIYGSPAFIRKAWDALLASKEVTPCGLGCRDTLRFEVGLPLYGNELSEEITPLEAGLGMFVKLDKGDFVGRDAIVAQKTEGLKRKVVGIELNGRAIPRHGYEVEADGKVVGSVTTGYQSVSTGKSVCMALIDKACAEIGTNVGVRIRKRLQEGVVTKKRFYDKHYKK
ncbi:glycine cleavage system aminomethyltransferase GcvT [Alloprevotella sp. OH1205_COT-284]|uniref:glycine cleavage system aminomethyltransferase GcvT n=1 Tax=Alloprevotella sp. OH1205_COT-284 TaxID=2491043 RepID=UPI000F5E265A|nr:glycine cleavage system aminomethyltransferase GcvT [Alloprevotella sp. OH1205_COT-284]RRD80369.1 glycine cleavage system aminomethyltransferase GcvT [Alloprevotella sp. OH1205_COT-284]